MSITHIDAQTNMQAEHQYALKDIMNFLPQPPNTEITSVYGHMQLLHLSGKYHQTALDPNTMNARILKILKMLYPSTTQNTNI